MTTASETPWLHRWAVLTAVATFAQLFAGSLVTTLRAGMEDPIWPTYPWHLALIDWTEPKAGFVIEHSHRALGYLVGCLIIVLMLWLLVGQRRRGLRLLGVAALGCVIVQGVLGGVRVLLDRKVGPELAMVHGCFAQIVFAVTVTLAVVTGPGWGVATEDRALSASARRLRRATLLALGLVYLQIVFGAVLRHSYSVLGPRGHLLVAFCVVAAVAWVVKEVWEHHRAERGLAVPALILAGLVALQLSMGVETWLIRYTATAPAHQLGVRTAHVLLGSLVLAAVVVVALQARRRVALAVNGEGPPAEPLGGPA